MALAASVMASGVRMSCRPRNAPWPTVISSAAGAASALRQRGRRAGAGVSGGAGAGPRPAAGCLQAGDRAPCGIHQPCAKHPANGPHPPDGRELGGQRSAPPHSGQHTTTTLAGASQPTNQEAAPHPPDGQELCGQRVHAAGLRPRAHGGQRAVAEGHQAGRQHAAQHRGQAQRLVGGQKREGFGPNHTFRTNKKLSQAGVREARGAQGRQTARGQQRWAAAAAAALCRRRRPWQHAGAAAATATAPASAALVAASNSAGQRPPAA